MADEKPKIDIGKEVEKLEDMVRGREWLVDKVTASSAADIYKAVGDDPSVLSDKKKVQGLAKQAATIYDGHAAAAGKSYFGGTKNLDELGYHTTGKIGLEIGNQLEASGKDWKLSTISQQGQDGKKHAMQFPNVKLMEGIKALPTDAVKSYLGLDPKRPVNDDLFKDAQTMYQIIKGVQAKETLYK